jgi:haloalkane dehalogenase
MPNLDVLDSTIAYRDQGAGAPIVLLHGNPTSSHLWRGVLAQYRGRGRLLAPDLIGMGESGKPPISYSFDDHARYLDAWLAGVGAQTPVFVGHDWGGALAFDWARRHPDRIRGIAFLETIIRPMAWADLSAGAQEFFRSIRTPGEGEAIVLDANAFIEQALPATMATGLSEADHAAYRRPFPSPETRIPILRWARSLPLDGEPADVVARVTAYGRWLATSPTVPKLLLAFEPGPGVMMTPAVIAWTRATVAGLEVASLGLAGHHAPEDQPEAIAAALERWVDQHGLGSIEDRPAPHGEA